ncbi:hypothetical protein LTS17_004621 [Exophiala oligosperma]
MLPNFSLRGRTAVVTGGVGGMGTSFTRALVDHGANVAVFDLRMPEGELLEAAKAKSVKVRGYIVDVTSMESLTNAYTRVEKDFDGKLDIFVGAAGISHVVDFLDVDWESHLKVITVNQMGLYHSAQLAGRLMIKSGTKHGSMILIGSASATNAPRSVNTSAYNSTKGAVVAMTMAIAKEMGVHGIRVNSVSPGYCITPLTREYHQLHEAWAKESMLGFVPDGDDIAGTCIFLAGDASRAINAFDLVIDGGATKW